MEQTTIAAIYSSYQYLARKDDSDGWWMEQVGWADDNTSPYYYLLLVVDKCCVVSFLFWKSDITPKDVCTMRVTSTQYKVP